MIYQVAIKSLPQDWLWCETWCDDESKQRAKTIDLVSVCGHLYISQCENVQIEVFSLLQWNGTHTAHCCLVCSLLLYLLRWPKYRAVSGGPQDHPQVCCITGGLAGLRISSYSWLCFIPVGTEQKGGAYGVKSRESQMQLPRASPRAASRSRRSPVSRQEFHAHGKCRPPGTLIRSPVPRILPEGCCRKHAPACRIPGA